MHILKLIITGPKALIFKFIIQTHLYWRTVEPIYPRFAYETKEPADKIVPDCIQIIANFLSAIVFYSMWFILKVFWELVAINRSKWFTWKKKGFKLKYYDFEGKMAEIPARFDAPPRSTSRNKLQAKSWKDIVAQVWKEVLMTNFVWQRVATFHPAAGEDVTEYIVGIVREYDGAEIYSTLIVRGEIGLLQGPEVVKVFAFRVSDAKPIKLVRLRDNVSKWKLKKVPLL